MNRDELLRDYFNTDASGNDLDGIKEHYVRTNRTLITKNKSLEFNYIMDVLIPDWVQDKHLIQGGGNFYIEKIDYDTEAMCICTQPIHDICYLKHPLLNQSVQVGNHCVGKINKELEKEAERMQRLYKKQQQYDRIKKWNDYQKILMKQHLALCKERDDLVARVERENDEYELSKIFRKCKKCSKYNILAHEPNWKVNCYKCYKK